MSYRLLLPLVFVLLVAACFGRVFEIQVPQGYAGPVHIVCGSNPGAASAPVIVDQSGQGVAGSCPSTALYPKVKVTRGSEAIAPSDVQWVATGDGIKVGLNLT